MVPRAQLSLQPKRHVGVHYFIVGRYVFSKNCPFLLGDPSPSNIWHLGPAGVINKRHLDRFSRMRHKCFVVQCIVSGEEKPQHCPFPWDIVTPPEEDRATAIRHKIW